mmetsp:Transcript_5855/g.9430  ORF Transcript_5855/g.9430 Transcript_5855/m.9430 type:complete len:111 (+) Transcript_5855:5147-5479(+)
MNTTVDLQNYPVDLHINYAVKAEDKSLTATGRYYNDDGTTLESIVDGKNYNFYEIFAGGSLTEMTLSITVEASGSKKKKNINDQLGKIIIYNAEALGFDSNMNFTVNKGT